MRNVILNTAFLAILLLGGGTQTEIAAQEPPGDGPFSVEYYYKIRWGHVDEWMALYRKNHYPVLVPVCWTSRRPNQAAFRVSS